MALCDERKSDFLLPVYLSMDVFKATYWLLHPASLLAHLMDNNQQSYIYKKNHFSLSEEYPKFIRFFRRVHRFSC